MADGSDELFGLMAARLQLGDDQLERARAAWERALELLSQADGSASAALQQVLMVSRL